MAGNTVSGRWTCCTVQCGDDSAKIKVMEVSMVSDTSQLLLYEKFPNERLNITFDFFITRSQNTVRSALPKIASKLSFPQSPFQYWLTTACQK